MYDERIRRFSEFSSDGKIRNKLRKMLKFIFNLENKHPLIGRSLVYCYYILNSVRFIIGKKLLLIKNRSKYGKLYFNKTYWVNPKKIQYLSGIRVNKWYYYSRILKGDWDQPKKSYEDTILYQTTIQRFREGKKWEETISYQLGLSKINNGEVQLSKEEFDEMFRKFESLYHEIKRNGIKPKRELSSSKRGYAKFDIRTKLDEISVDIGRDGQFLSVHGRHRLSIAKLLNIPEVPVTIILRHKKWMDFRRYLILYFRNYESQKKYGILSHPDLQNIPFKYGEFSDNLIRENISISKGKVLDINAKIGYFCHKLEDEGFDCYALEENRKFFYLLKKLKKVENKRFRIISESILEYNKNKELVFDVVLALNVFHNYLKTKDTYSNLINFLKRLKVKELIFGTHNLKEFKKNEVYRNYNPDQFVNFILENSCLNKAKYIGKTKTGRALYKLTSESLSS